MPNRKHFVIPRIGRDEPFAPVVINDNPKLRPVVPNRQAHAGHLIDAVRNVQRNTSGAIGWQDVMGVPEQYQGTRLKLVAGSTFGIDAEKLRKKTLQLDILSSVGKGREQIVRAFIHKSSFDSLVHKIEKYGDWDPEEGKREPNFSDFFEQIGTIAFSEIEEHWKAPDDVELPREGSHRWELWLRTESADLTVEIARAFRLEVKSHLIKFPTSSVIEVEGTYESLKSALETAGSIIEFRPASAVGLPPMRLTPVERREIVRGLEARLALPDLDAPLTTILDTGVNNGHPLLAGSLPVARLHALLPAWQKEDALGHGTMMAGAALYGNLNRWLGSTDPIALTTALESVAVLGAGAVHPGSLAERIDNAIGMVEGTAARKRVFSVSLRSPEDRSDGLPTALSGKIDQLAFNRGGAAKRLFCLPAGNCDQAAYTRRGYISTNDELGIETPGQAVNALTVGAYAGVDSSDFPQALASMGDLCPTSRTAMQWDMRLSHKPDIVMEGGNVELEEDGSARFVHELGVLTTSHEIPNRPFAIGIETSIATAAAAGLATRLQALYPEFWPETIRGLIVNSARWTPQMKRRRRNPNDRQQTLGLLRRFGWGVPDEQRASYSASHALTLLVQDEVDLFELDDGELKIGNMRFYRIPWPIEALMSIPTTEVRMRVTLSYFAEPMPLAASYGRKNDYVSHHIDFDVCGPDDNDDDAIYRLNAKYKRAIGRRTTPERDHSAWVLGPEARSLGTLKQDEWVGKASDLARMNGIAIYPTHGWWKRIPDSNPQTRVRYALIVTIETPSTDISTEVQAAINRIESPVSTAIETDINSFF